MIIWKCDICGKTAYARDHPDWCMRRRIFDSEEVDICDTCSRELMCWLSGHAKIVTDPEARM